MSKWATLKFTCIDITTNLIVIHFYSINCILMLIKKENTGSLQNYNHTHYITLSLNYNLQDQDFSSILAEIIIIINNNTLFNLLPWSQTLITLQSSTRINGCHTDTGENTNLCSVILSDGPLFDQNLVIVYGSKDVTRGNFRDIHCQIV